MLDPSGDIRDKFIKHKAKARRKRRKLSGHTPYVLEQTEVDSFGSMAGAYYSIMQLSKTAQDMPKRGTYGYTEWLDSIWKQEPILAGAVYSMVAKMQSMTWIIKGRRSASRKSAIMLAEAAHMNGHGWTGFISPSAQDFYVQDNGVWWGMLRLGGKYGKLASLHYIDTRCCIPTGNAAHPMYYHSSLTSDEHWYQPQEYIHFNSMPSGDERDLGVGFSAVSRAVRAAKLLMALHDYDAEKLANLPPEGVATVTGLSFKEFTQAVTMWKAERQKNNSLTFPQVLWLIGNSPGAKVEVDIQAFSTIPESFDRQTVVAQYVNTLALCFGVDTREFWAISSGALGTAAETEVQHLKARGKGGGEFIVLVERKLNSEMPEDVTFEFDTQDIQEDMVSAEVAKLWIDAYIKLVYPPAPQGATEAPEGVIDAKTFKRLLADKGVLPEWAVGDDRIAITSHDVHKDVVEDIVSFIWKCGRLREIPIINLSYQLRGEVLKQKAIAIRGTPIADNEVDRGARITRKALKAEFQIWNDIPELKEYVPDWALDGEGT